jgi:hypothetical protein
MQCMTDIRAHGGAIPSILVDSPPIGIAPAPAASPDRDCLCCAGHIQWLTKKDFRCAT